MIQYRKGCVPVKKVLFILLVLCLCFSFAGAERSIESKTTEANNLYLNETAGTMCLSVDSDSPFQVIDRDLNVLSDGYYRMGVWYEFYEVTGEDGKSGVLDGQGQVLLPPVYDAIERISDRWIAGITLAETTDSDYDYQSLDLNAGNRKHYKIDTVDLYFQGEKKGTISRDEWSSYDAHGDYLILKGRNEEAAAYNKDFVKSEVEVKYTFYEYIEDYGTGTVIHAGSGQEAFVPGCTLTPEEVKEFLWIRIEDETKTLIDLQGNVIADLSGYYSANVLENNLVELRNEESKCGLMDASGQVLIECKYDRLDDYQDYVLKAGYVYAERDGMCGFVNLKDGSETGFEYAASACDRHPLFIETKDEAGNIILISAAIGTLEETYQDVYNPFTVYHSAAPYASVQEADGRIHVIDIYGNDVLPDMPEVSSIYSASFSEDRSLIVIRAQDDVCHIYSVSEGD